MTTALTGLVAAVIGFVLGLLARIAMQCLSDDSAPIADAPTDPPSDQFPVYERFLVVKNATGSRN